MKWKTWMSGAVLLRVAAIAALPIGTAHAADDFGVTRAALDQFARVAAAPDFFGRSAISVNFFTKSMSDSRRGRGKAGKPRK